jgi:ATP-binding cassette subfamily B protein
MDRSQNLKRSRSTDFITIREFWRASRRYPKHLILAHLSPVSAIGLGVVIPFAIGKILGGLAQGDVDNSWLVLLVIASILAVVANRIAFLYYLGLVPLVMADLQKNALDMLLQRSHGFHNNNVAGKLVSDVVDYPNAYSQLAGAWFVDILPFALIVVFGIVIVAINSPLIGLVILLMTAIAVWSTLYFRHRMTPFRKRRLQAVKKVTAHVGDAIVNAPAIKAYAGENRELAMHDALGKKLKESRLHDWHELAKDGSWRIAGLLAFEIIFIVVAIHQVRQNPDLLATGIFAFSYTITLTNRLFQIGNMARQVEESLLSAEPITLMLQETVEITDAKDAAELSVKEGTVNFNNVRFRYNDNPDGRAVFPNLTLSIEPGEKIGLVGPSGGGKSTFTKLLLRFEDIDEGAISIDSQNIAQVTQQSLRQAIAYVPQEPLLFHRSIHDNIAYGKPDAPSAEIEHAAKRAHATSFIKDLPHGYDTIVGERGVKLSGGQRQRIAIARAILKNAPILVLDEATSALDSESEKAIQQALWELMKDKTAIVIAHRLSTIQKMDRIIVLDEGKIVEQGSHQELLAQNGTYAKLWAHQSGGFIEE